MSINETGNDLSKMANKGEITMPTLRDILDHTPPALTATGEKPLDKVKEQAPRKRSREREGR